MDVIESNLQRIRRAIAQQTSRLSPPEPLPFDNPMNDRAPPRIFFPERTIDRASADRDDLIVVDLPTVDIVRPLPLERPVQNDGVVEIGEPSVEPAISEEEQDGESQDVSIWAAIMRGLRLAK